MISIIASLALFVVLMLSLVVIIADCGQKEIPVPKATKIIFFALCLISGTVQIVGCLADGGNIAVLAGTLAAEGIVLVLSWRRLVTLWTKPFEIMAEAEDTLEECEIIREGDDAE